MNKLFVLLPLTLVLSACGGKTELAPRLYMPAPPEILMRSPRDLNTIKKNNLTVTEESVAVEAPKDE